jgi:hypothetical protein
VLLHVIRLLFHLFVDFVVVHHVVPF